MKARDGLEFVWAAGYVFLLAVILAYPWITFYVELVSPLPIPLWSIIVIAPLCGSAVYLFIRSLLKSLGVTFIMCVLSYVIIGAFFSTTSYQISVPHGQWIALRIMLVTFPSMIYILPLSLGGCWATSRFFPK